MNPGSIYKKQTHLFILLLACMAFVFVVRPWDLYFLNDDFIHIPLGNDFLFVRAGFLRPVPNFFLMWDRYLYGKNALGYFSTSLLLHFISVFSVYALVRAIDSHILGTQESIMPLLAAMLFLCYPYHAEPIMWVIGRVAIIAATFTFLSLYYYIKSEDKAANVFLSWLFFFLALFTYESIWNVALLFVLISIFKVTKNRSVLKRELLLSSFMVLNFVAYLLFRKYALGTVTGDGYTEIQENISNIPLLLLNTVKLTGRNFTPPFVKTVYGIAFFAVSVVFYCWCIFKLSLNKKLVYFSLVLWVAIVSGVVTAAPLGIDTHYNESERYIYYSSFFYCLFLAIIISYLLPVKKQLWVGAGMAVVFLLLFLNLQSNYAEASAVTKGTVSMFKNNTTYKRAVVIDVPAKHYGVPVLRITPQALIDWIVPNAACDSVVILSQTLNGPLSKPYPLKSANWQDLAKQKNWDARRNEVQDSTGKKIELLPDDILLWYKTDGLYKVDVPIQLLQKKE